MRPPTTAQDPLRTPLNALLGAEGAVRVLRVLAAAHSPMGRTSVAERAALNPSGVRRILDQLALQGMVEVAGSGRNQVVSLRDAHPLADAVRALFGEERRLFDEFLATLRAALHEKSVDARAVWIEPGHRPLPGTIHVGLLAQPADLDDDTRHVERHLRAVGETLAMHFVVHGYTLADLDDVELDDVSLLYGWLPRTSRGPGGAPARWHRDLDARALALGEAIADLLPEDSSIVSRAAEWIERRLGAAGPQEARELEAWRSILRNHSLKQIQALLRDPGERATRLRQSLPFADALSPAQRRAVFQRAAGPPLP
jgi:hypothetical protein